MVLYQSFLVKLGPIQLNQRSFTWDAMFHLLNMKMLHVVKCSTIGVNLEKSETFYRGAGRRLSTTKPVDKEAIMTFITPSCIEKF